MTAIMNNDDEAWGEITVTSDTFEEPDDRAVSVLVHARAFSPRVMVLLPVPGQCSSVEISAGHAFMECGEAGLQVADVSDRCAPRLVGSASIPGSTGDAFDAVVVGDRVLVAYTLPGLPSVCRPLVVFAEESKNNSYQAGSVSLDSTVRGGFTAADIPVRTGFLAYVPVGQPPGVRGSRMPRAALLSKIRWKPPSHYRPRMCR